MDIKFTEGSKRHFLGLIDNAVDSLKYVEKNARYRDWKYVEELLVTVINISCIVYDYINDLEVDE